MSERAEKIMGVDFAALHTLHAVQDHGSFTRAAEALGVTQSVVSYTIEKLRKVFDDPLFVRFDGRQKTTARCETILETTRNMMDDFLRLAEPDTLDMTQVEARLVIACNYYERIVLIPDMVKHLRAVAPKLELEIVSSADIGPDQLIRSHADLLIGPFQRNDAAFYSAKLFDEHYVCVIDPAHPAAMAPLTLEAYLGLEHIEITYGDLWTSGYQQQLAQSGHQMRIPIRVPSPAGLPKLIAGSPFVATVPRRLADHFKSELTILECPVPAPFDVRMIWTGRVHKSPLHATLRKETRRAVELALGAAKVEAD